MRSNNKKKKPLSATSLKKIACKHTTRVQIASCSSKPTRTNNPGPNTLSD